MDTTISNFDGIHRIHLMGIGGAGMSGLALLLAELGFEVSGCDMIHTSYIDKVLKEEVAVVLGHEVAHAVAKHSAERLSQQMVMQYGGQALDVILSGKTTQTRQLAQTVYGLGAQYGVMLPYSRSNENEADQIGLIFTAMAGYNPQAAVSFWQRMSAQGTQKVPEFMSTHPSDATRVSNIQKLIPEAMKYYKK